MSSKMHEKILMSLATEVIIDLDWSFSGRAGAKLDWNGLKNEGDIPSRRAVFIFP